MSTSILTFCEIRITVSIFGHLVYTTIGERLVARDKPFIAVNEITIFAKGVRVTKIFTVESSFPPHPHIKDDVPSSDVKFEIVPSFP